MSLKTQGNFRMVDPIIVLAGRLTCKLTPYQYNSYLSSAILLIASDCSMMIGKNGSSI